MNLEKANPEETDSARQALAFIEAAVEGAERRVEAERRRLELLKLAAQTVRDAVEAGRPPELTMPLFEVASNGSRGPEVPPLSTVQAVRTILAAPANRGRFLSVKTMVHLMQNNDLLRRDLKYPQNTVLEAAKRLQKRDPVYVERTNRDGVALFRIRGEEEAPP